MAMYSRTYQFGCAIVAVAMIAGGGCRAAWYDGDYRDDRNSVATSKDAGKRPIARIAGPSAKGTATKAPAANEKASPQIDEAILTGVMEKVQQVSELDPAAAAQLLAELQEMPPTFWPAAAEQFRSSLAYRKQREQRAAGGQHPAAADGTPAAEAIAKNDDPSVARDTPMIPVRGGKGSSVQLASFNDAMPSRDQTQIEDPRAGRSETASRQYPTEISQHQSLAAKSWKDLTKSAADDLALRVAASPASTGEVHEHVTLRILQLLHGDTEQALAPIPGLSPAEQDYWSRQLFALATYLDHHSQPDDKRRAAASALHLDEALDSLREVGSLTVRNLTFCKKVLGYGAYEPHEATRFSPGQQLTLYVEVENYHCASTEKGFVTLLGSSYELLDEAGRRVGGDAFPDVEDTCRSRRRDFHIQYGLTLPAKIEPGSYRLQLTIRDRQGDKIGTSAIEFAIASAKTSNATTPTAKSGT
jgi:hypothetical protein